MLQELSPLKVSPRDWDSSFAAGPDLCSDAIGWRGGLLRRWHGMSPEMEQPPLDHHYMMMHLDEPKRITRTGDGPDRTVEAKTGAISLVSAGKTHIWTTEGPIGFAHLYLDPKLVARTVQERFDRDPRSVTLLDCVGSDAPLLRSLFECMLAQLEAPSFASKLMLDTLLQAFIVQLLTEGSTLHASTSHARHSLAPRRLQRVLDFIEAELAEEVSLDDLASVAESSRSHFSRAFRDATGFPPYRYLLHRRIEAAKTMLLESQIPISEVSERCGFKNSAQFTVMFKQFLGSTPARFRQEH